MNRWKFYWSLVLAVGIAGVAVATWLTVLWTRTGGVFVGVLITYPLGGIGGVLSARATIKLSGVFRDLPRRVGAEVVGGMVGFLAHTVGYVAAGGNVDALATLINTVGPGLLMAGVGTLLVEMLSDVLVALHSDSIFEQPTNR